MEHKELRRHIKVLERRRDFLAMRIEQRRGKKSTPDIGRDEGFDRAEFRALDVAIASLEDRFTALPPKVRAQAST